MVKSCRKASLSPKMKQDPQACCGVSGYSTGLARTKNMFLAPKGQIRPKAKRSPHSLEPAEHLGETH